MPAFSPSLPDSRHVSQPGRRNAAFGAIRHRPRVSDRLVFDKLVQVAVFGCAYWRIADATCSATTLRRRRDEWIGLGVMDQLAQIAEEGYDQPSVCSSMTSSWTAAS